MPKIIKKKEMVSFEGIALADFLDKGFLHKLKKITGMSLASLVFVIKEKKEGKDVVYPIILNHESEEAIKRKIININTPELESKTFDDFIKVLEEIE